jgi:hypothetical protein
MLTMISQPTVFSVTVNDTKPIFFYCSQTVATHCQAGMVGVVNPIANQTLASYQKKAAAVLVEAGSPVSAFGGILRSNATAATTAATTTSATTTGTTSRGTSQTTSKTTTTARESATATSGASKANLGVGMLVGAFAMAL